jgi:hypothetical protein
MHAATTDENASGQREFCSVVVLYDDTRTRARALAACNYLVSQIQEAVDPAFHWWRTDFLKDPLLAQAAAQDAVGADFVIVCSAEASSASAAVTAWFEGWIGRRQKPEGVLINLDVPGVLDTPISRSPEPLREVARRGRFDYLLAEARRDTRPPTHFGPNA